MCDGTLVQKLINYDFESAKEEKASWSGENIVKVPYKIDGTGFDGVVVVESYNTDTWKEELEKKGYKVNVVLKGLGEYPAIQELFIQHVKFASKHQREDITVKKKKYEKTDDID